MTAKRKPAKRAVTKKAAVKHSRPETMWPIESGVPIPPRRGGSGGELTKTMRAMNIGDSFVVDSASKRSLFPTAARLGIRIATRTTEDGKVRVWLLEYKD